MIADLHFLLKVTNEISIKGKQNFVQWQNNNYDGSAWAPCKAP